MYLLTYYFPNVNPIYLHKREGTDDDPFLYLQDTNYVFNSEMLLKEIPSHKQGVEVFDKDGEQFTEVDSDEIGINEFRVDYTIGKIRFHESHEGSEFTAKYWGMGFVSIPSDRIFVPNSSEDPLLTLQNILDNVEVGTEVIETVKGIKFIGEYDPEYQYRKWNFVSFSNKSFVATANIKGLSPNESSDWKLVSSGVGFAGVYDSDKTYTVGDIVADPESKNIYFSKIVDNTYPLTDEGSWEVMLTVDDLVEKVDRALQQLEEFQELLESSDEDREQNEKDRQDAFEDLMEDYESFRQLVVAEEEQRDANEIERMDSETERKQFFTIAQTNEATRESQESARVLAETARNDAFNVLLNSVQEGVGESLETIDENLEEYKTLKVSVENLIDQVEQASESVDERLYELGGFVAIDEFDIETAYNKYNIVSHEGSSYMAKQDTQGNDVEDDMFWFPIALRGLDNTSISIDGVSPDEEGVIHLDDLDIVRNETFNDFTAEITGSVGDMNGLTTVNNNNMVEAINELKRRIDNIVDFLNIGQ